MNTRSVLVFATDTDIAVLLIAHCHRLPCQNIYFGAKTDVINIDVLHTFFGSERATCLLSFHSLTGCDTVRKFNIVSKESWTKPFLDVQSDQDLMIAFRNF